MTGQGIVLSAIVITLLVLFFVDILKQLPYVKEIGGLK